MNRTLLVFSFLILFLNIGCPLFMQASSEVSKKSISGNDRTAKIMVQNAIEAEATRLAEAGRYDEAIQKFQEAIRPELINREAEKGLSLFSILQIHQWQGKYELALQELQWFLKIRPEKDSYQDKKLELEALINARETGSFNSIYKHIQYLQDKYLSPNGFRGDAEMVVPTILRLYDHIGDYDKAIAFIDEIRAYGLRNSSKEVLNVRNAQEAWEKYQELHKNHNADWHDYKLSYEYLKVREAFEQDRAEGTKGRAMKVLIQSDYFPW